MEYQDKWIDCANCGKAFVFSGRDQAYYADQGFKNQPKRCRECRALLKRRNDVAADGMEKELVKAFCAACARVTYVPFKPTGSKPIYCRDCLVAKKIEAAAQAPAQPPMSEPTIQPPAAI